MKSYELALNKPYNGIPTDIRVAYEDMSLPVPANSNEEMYQQLRKLGYDRVSISSNLEANWNRSRPEPRHQGPFGQRQGYGQGFHVWSDGRFHQGVLLR